MKNSELSRRSFIGGTAALSVATMLPNLANAAKPNSKFNGVQIGLQPCSTLSMMSPAPSGSLPSSGSGQRFE